MKNLLLAIATFVGLASADTTWVDTMAPAYYTTGGRAGYTYKRIHIGPSTDSSTVNTLAQKVASDTATALRASSLQTVSDSLKKVGLRFAPLYVSSVIQSEDLTVIGSASARVAIMDTAQATLVQLTYTGFGACRIRLGSSSVAATATDMQILSGGSIVLPLGAGQTWIAGYGDGGGGTLNITSGTNAATQTSALPVVSGTLAAILSAIVPAAGTIAQPTDIFGTSLQSNGTTWDGYMGTFANLTSINATYKVNLGNVYARVVLNSLNHLVIWNGTQWIYDIIPGQRFLLAQYRSSVNASMPISGSGVEYELWKDTVRMEHPFGHGTYAPSRLVVPANFFGPTSPYKFSALVLEGEIYNTIADSTTGFQLRLYHIQYDSTGAGSRTSTVGWPGNSDAFQQVSKGLYMFKVRYKLRVLPITNALTQPLTQVTGWAPENWNNCGGVCGVSVGNPTAILAEADVDTVAIDWRKDQVLEPDARTGTVVTAGALGCRAFQMWLE